MTLVLSYTTPRFVLQVSDRLVTDRVAMRFADPLADLAPGEGKIVYLGGQKVAAFGDTDGTVTGVSPYCAHLRCIVSFDEPSGEWHCPCHGSRFATDGRVLHGPAKRPLDAMSIKSDG